jgi:hypothetical protein
VSISDVLCNKKRYENGDEPAGGIRAPVSSKKKIDEGR